MTEMQLNAVCKILGIDQTNANDVEIINLLFGMFENAVCLKIGGKEVPEELEWIVNECVIKRFQLIGAEHLESEGIDVLSSAYRNPSILLDEYDSYFSAYIAIYNDEETFTTKRNRCRMI